MGRKKRNLDGRQTKEVPQKEETTPKIQVDIDVDTTKYDPSNALIIEKKEKGEKSSQKNKPQVKLLSKKKRKKLEMVVKRRQKKTDRSTVLEELSKYQITGDELKSLASVSMAQTKGVKRGLELTVDKEDGSSERNNKKVRRGDAPVWEEETEDKVAKAEDEQDVVNDPNIVKFNGSQLEEEDESEEETDVNKVARNNLPQTITSEADPVQVRDKIVKRNEILSLQLKSDAKTQKKLDKEKRTQEGVKAPTYFIEVHRNQDIIESRNRLPILVEEQAIMESIRYHDVVILCGETGSGKTTQLPQFLYEAGYAQEKQICITEPRRVAAMSVCERVGHEMNLRKEVSYHIRYDNTINPSTRIKFVTDGVLLKEIQQDFLLTKYSVIIIDEAHERSVFSDILVGLLSRIVPLRKKKGSPLKLVIMSATLRVDDFTQNRKLFKEIPPVIKINSRQFPVTIHFSKKTQDDYIQAAFNQICKIHRKQPEGGILVFVTGRYDVNILCRKLRRTFSDVTEGSSTKHPRVIGTKNRVAQVTEEPEAKESDGSQQEAFNKGKGRGKTKPKTMDQLLPKINLDDYTEMEATFAEEVNSDIEEEENSASGEDSSSDDEGENEDDKEDYSDLKEPLYVLPLYSMLPKDKQSLVFKPPPPGYRLCIISTNVAETSLTIPNIKYVVDTGKVKTKVYDKTTGVSAFRISWTSKASSDQRAGRAGRTSAGHCYRLYSSAVFNNDFPQFSEPEIIVKPIDDLVLQMKSLDISNVLNFPFPTPPSAESLLASEKRLLMMDALEEVKASTLMSTGRKGNRLTSLGRAMSHFPVSPRYSKMLAFSYHELFPYVIALVAGLTVQEIFINDPVTHSTGPEEEQGELDKNRVQVKTSKWKNLRRRWSGSGNEHLLGDLMVFLKAIGASEFTGGSASFCTQNGIRHKAMSEVHKLRKQLTQEVNQVFGPDRGNISLSLDPPSDTHALHLRQIALAGFADQVARKIPPESVSGGKDASKKKRLSYQSMQLNDPVYLDNNCILMDDKPEYVVYQEIHESSKLYMRNVVAIEAEWLPLYARNHCNLSKVLDDPPPEYDEERDCVTCSVSGTFGPHGWPIPVTRIEFPDGDERYKWFARFLLDGCIIKPVFSTMKDKLLTKSGVIVKSWAKLQPKIMEIADQLGRHKISSCKSLVRKWKSDPTYLLKEYEHWVPEVLHPEIQSNWPPVK